MENLKPLLITYAYNILGSVEDAKDIVQDAFLKYQLVPDKERISDEKAYLVRMVINLSINHKNKLRRLAAAYPGEWLPEPIETDTIDTVIEKKDVLSYSLMVLLEKLNPKQRAVFILKEAFDYDHEEIAEVLNITAENSRQLLNRAKKQLQKDGVVTDSAINKEQVDKYLDIISKGDTLRLEQLLTEDISVISDGGGKAVAFVNPIKGRKDVAAVLYGVYRKFYSKVRIEKSEINHQPALFYYDDKGQLVTCQILVFENDILTNVYFMRNPDKLQGLQKKFA
jgi:RNA polymerase sigma-70 factor (ECF subfamily)